MELRPYQVGVLEGVEAGWAEASKQLVVVPTGGGKTVIFSHLAARRQPGRTLVLAHREELIDQAIAKLHAATRIYAQKEKAESRASLEAPVVVASVQSMVRRLDRWPADHFSLVICDEAHHALSDSWQTVLKHFDGEADVLGVTATPDRGDRRDLGVYFQRLAAEVGLFDLVGQGFLSRIAVKALPLKIDLDGVRSVAGDFAERDLGDALEPYLAQIAAAVREHASFRKVLAFLPLIETSRKFVEACRAAGLSAAHVDGESPDRAELLARFRDGEFDILSNAMLLTEGYDEPSIDCVLVLRPTRSRSLFAQMVGRGTRVAPHKRDLLLLDFLWNHTRLGVVHPACLVAKSEEEAAAITKKTQETEPGGELEQQDLLEVAASAAAEREESLRKRLAELADRKAREITAEEFAMKHRCLAVAEYEETMPWEKNPITEKQAVCLQRAGISLESVRGRGHASALLGLAFRGRPLRKATPAQVAMLRRMRWRSPDGMRGPDDATENDMRAVWMDFARKKRERKEAANAAM
jgi:superfamily II DNA or RNA helicase